MTTRAQEIALRLKAEWYRNGMHDIRRRTTLNNVPPLTLSEVRAAVVRFEGQLFSALAELET